MPGKRLSGKEEAEGSAATNPDATGTAGLVIELARFALGAPGAVSVNIHGFIHFSFVCVTARKCESCLGLGLGSAGAWRAGKGGMAGVLLVHGDDVFSLVFSLV